MGKVEKTKSDTQAKSLGKIIRIVGDVVDVDFDLASLPAVYDALRVVETGLVLEVQMQIGGGVVRTIAMGSAQGLARGLNVEGTGAPITVPVGDAMLGRIVNVLGEPIDEAGPIETKETAPIHREPPAFGELSTGVELLVTGIKVVDLLTPIAKGGKVAYLVVQVSVKPLTCWSSLTTLQFSIQVVLYLLVWVSVPEKVMTFIMK